MLKGDPATLATRSGYGHERFERVEFQTKVAEGFEKLFERLEQDNIKIVEIGDKNLE